MKNLLTPPKLAPCRAPVWAKTGHLQTMLGHLLPSTTIPIPSRKVEVPLPDGDLLIAEMLPGESSLVVYLFHGLGGHSQADYMQRTARLVQRQGHTVLMVNHRGCGAGEGLATGPYHSGRAEDVSEVLKVGKRLFPDRKHLAIGFSLGGNALLLLLTGERGTTLPDAAIAVNAPINLARCADLISQGWNRVYDIRFVKLCREAAHSRFKSGRIKEKISIPTWGTLKDVDDRFIVKLGGFSDRHDYYRTCSTHKLLTKISTPTFLLTAKDDPFVHFKDYVAAKLSPSVHLEIQDRGGHMGYLTRAIPNFKGVRWLDYALDAYIQHIHSF